MVGRYEQQECVVFDDMRKDTFKFHELLRFVRPLPVTDPG